MKNSGWALPVAILAGALTLGAADASAQTALPTGVTQAMVDQGKTLYHGPALCSSCHGENGAGTAIGHGMQQRDQHACAARSQRMTQCDGTAVYIQPRVIPRKPIAHRQ